MFEVDNVLECIAAVSCENGNFDAKIMDTSTTVYSSTKEQA